jgi:two-component system, OmpR family, KDP operon response regulator KdpE
MRTVLVIDDHLPTLTTLCTVLRLNGYYAVDATNAQEAELKFRGNPISMVIVDHGLPGINGSMLAGHLKAIRNVLVLMLSGNPEVKEKPADVDLLLAKPQQVPDLLAAMAKLFSENGV